MANPLSLENIDSYLSKENLLPVFFLIGKDRFSLENAVSKIKSAVEPLLASEFDLEIISMDKGLDLNSVLDSALAFPFGSEKKLIIVRGFENTPDKKKLLPYLSSPADFTVLVFTYNGEMRNYKQQPFAELIAKGYLFEDRKLRPSELVNWIIGQAKKSGLEISYDNAMMLMEFVGNEKALLEMQLEKFAGYLNNKGEITAEIIENLSSVTKEFSIFELQDAIGSGNKAKAMRICYNLLDSGTDLIQINAFLSKYITTLASAWDYKRKGIPNDKAARELQVSPYYYKKCSEARYLLNERRLHNAAEALLNSELELKTTGIEQKTIAAKLIAEILQ